MPPALMWPELTLIQRALEEDLGTRGDLTTRLVVPEDTKGEAVILAQEEGVLCGLPIAIKVFQYLDPSLTFQMPLKDGDFLRKGREVLRIRGPLAPMLTGERTALNFLGRLSGIATLTRKFVEALAGTPIRLLDTRKTTPGLRALEKYAVRIGGGQNHRFGLFDGILIKDNHIRAVGSVKEAVRRARAKAPHGMKVEVEVSSLEEVKEALEAGADLLLLDNMTPEEVRKALNWIQGRAPVEVSGGITLENIRDYAMPGVSYISAGALTHSARWLNFSMEVIHL